MKNEDGLTFIKSEDLGDLSGQLWFTKGQIDSPRILQKEKAKTKGEVGEGPHTSGDSNNFPEC